MNCLHIVNKSPYRESTFAQCVASLGQNDSILLIEDGVYATTGDILLSLIDRQKQTNEIFVLQSDLESRGLSSNFEFAKVINHDDFVDLVVKHANSVSWF